VVTAVIGGAIATELLIRDREPARGAAVAGGHGRADTAGPAGRADPGDASGPIDELDDRDSGMAGPVYRDEPSAPNRAARRGRP
jgi:hypothetical protein